LFIPLASVAKKGGPKSPFALETKALKASRPSALAGLPILSANCTPPETYDRAMLGGFCAGMTATSATFRGAARAIRMPSSYRR